MKLGEKHRPKTDNAADFDSVSPQTQIHRKEGMPVASDWTSAPARISKIPNSSEIPEHEEYHCKQGHVARSAEVSLIVAHQSPHPLLYGALFPLP